MKRILLADDDFLVRSYLSQLVDWEANGYMLAGVAQDGAQALELAEKLQPDIVIADIDMPVMNGISLLQKLRERRHPAKVIMLSCHDDFEYVKEAMRTGAEEYLLKDTVTPEKLLQTLQELAPADDTEETQERMEEQEREQLLRLLEGTALSCESIAPDAVIAVRLTEYEETMAYQPMEQREQFYRSFLQTCEGAGKNLAAVRCIHVRGGLFAVLCAFRTGMGRQSQQLALRETATALVQEADRHFAAAVKLGVSDAAEYSTEISSCWRDAKNALEHAFYQPGSIFYAWQCGKMGDMLPRAAEEFLKWRRIWRHAGTVMSLRRCLPLHWMLLHRSRHGNLWLPAGCTVQTGSWELKPGQCPNVSAGCGRWYRFIPRYVRKCCRMWLSTVRA